jgi:hypothetical protein
MLQSLLIENWEKVLKKIVRAYLNLTFLIPEHLPEENNENHQGIDTV